MLAKNPMFHAKTKHIEVKYHFIQDMLEDKTLHCVKVHTDDNSMDILTKVLPPKRFAHCRSLMGVNYSLLMLYNNLYNTPCPIKDTLSFKWEVVGVKGPCAALVSWSGGHNECILIR